MRRALIVLPLVAALAGCGDDTTSGTTNPTTNPSPTASATPEPTIAALTVRCVPSLVPAVPAANPAFAWQISWVLEVRETDGIAGRLNFLQVTIADQQVLVMDAAGIAAAAGSPNVAARGALPIPLTLQYTLPDGGRLANVTATVNFTDSRGNVIVASGQLRII